ncbi:hypothetical protein C8Q76DRAFT_798451 [Earliella scabrosa]|nr:hypothetical protein C8Q76DRAFT_798451 [Earliella scabrosa]
MPTNPITVEASSTTQSFETLCNIKRAIFDTKAQLEADLFDALKVHSGDEISAWSQRFLVGLRDRNERYRHSILTDLRNAARRARLDNAPEKLAQGLKEILDLSISIRGEATKIIALYEHVLPTMAAPQQAFLRAESDWIRSGYSMIDQAQVKVEAEFMRTKELLDILTMSEEDFERILSPLKTTPPGISSASLDPICRSLYRLWEQRCTIAQKAYDAVSAAFSTWFNMDGGGIYMVTGEHVKQMEELRDTMIAQVTRQAELLTSISLFGERAENAPSVVVTGSGRCVEVLELLTAMQDYDGAMEAINDVYDLEIALLQKAKTWAQEAAPLVGRFA